MTKTRVIGGRQQMLRIDEEWGAPLPESDQERLLESSLPLLAAGIGVVVLSDYAKGCLTPRVCRAVIDAARRAGVPILVETTGDRDIPAVAREVFDVTGAGDTLIATLSAGLVGGLDLLTAVRLAIRAAGIVVGKVGTATVPREELLAMLAADPLATQDRKVCDLETLQSRAAEWRARGDRVVFTHGCFDLLHIGHITLLAKARAQGDRLVVGLNTDRSVRWLKGEGRPAVPQADRARMLASLAAIDAVILFDEETPLRLVEALHPDVLVKGADYADKEIAGADRVRSWGGAVVLIPLVDGQSTTRLLERRP